MVAHATLSFLILTVLERIFWPDRGLGPVVTFSSGIQTNCVIDYVRDQSASIPEAEHLLATTEVLESLLGVSGRFKRGHS
jgi:hypothetical protein